jgi:MarR family transcriptional regulator for hemolysin
MDPRTNFGFLLKDISRLYSRNFERHAAGHGLTLDQCRVLAHLSRHEGICQARLADLVDMDPMTMGRLLARMEANGLIERRTVRDDRRVRALHLRRPSGAMLETIWTLRELAYDEAVAGLGPRQRTQLMAAMNRIHRNLAALLPGIADEGGSPPAATRGRPPARTGPARR